MSAEDRSAAQPPSAPTAAGSAGAPASPPSTPAPRSKAVLAADDSTLIERIKWTSFARTVALSAVLALTVAWDLGLGPGPTPATPEVLLYQVCSAFFVLTFVVLAVAFFAPARLRVPTAWLSIGVDVALAMGLVAITGRTESVVLFAPPLAVLSAAALRERRGAMTAATVSAALFGLLAMVDAQWVAIDPTPWTVSWIHALTPATRPTAAEVALVVVVQVGALYATALLASRLVGELARARQRVLADQEQLAALRQRYEDVFSSMPDGLLTVSAAGTVQSANPAMLRILGLDSGAVLGRPLDQLVPALALPAGAATSTQELPRQPAPVWEIERAAADGARQVLAVRCDKLRGGLSAHHGRSEVLYVVRDVTAARRAEAEHRSRERLAAVGAMAMAVAHEIRNPLASIAGAVEMIAATTPADPSQAALMQIVVRETAQLSRWIGEFLGYARPSRPTWHPIEISAFVRDKLAAWQLDPRHAGAQLRLDSQIDEAGALLADINGLSSLLWNLLANAQQAAMDTSRPAVRVVLAGRPDDVMLTVEDNGAGLDDVDHERLFEPFFSTRSGGTGLGLATVKRVVESHGGTISVGRAELGGARFEVRLPRVPPGVSGEGEGEGRDHGQGAGG